MFAENVLCEYVYFSKKYFTQFILEIWALGTSLLLKVVTTIEGTWTNWSFIRMLIPYQSGNPSPTRYTSVLTAL